MIQETVAEQWALGVAYSMYLIHLLIAAVGSCGLVGAVEITARLMVKEER